MHEFTNKAAAWPTRWPLLLAVTLSCLNSTLALAQGAPASALATDKVVAGAVAAYTNRQFQQAADQLKAVEAANGRAAGLVCEMFVRKLLPADDERAQAACDTAAKAHDAHGLVWRALVGRQGNPAFNLPVSEALAMGYLAEAAELDYPPAFGRLCEMFFTKAKFQQAISFCQYSAAKAVPEGLYYFGLMSLEGKGVVQDFRKGHDALLLSAQTRHAPALLKLAEMARDGGAGQDKNPTVAYAWLLLASAADPDAVAIRNAKQSLAARLDEQQVKVAQKRAADWQPALPAPLK